eukprot:4338381-Amphidinium_carterae.1
MPHLIFYDVSHNLLTGTIPQGLCAQPFNDVRIFMSAGARKRSPSHPKLKLDQVCINDIRP